MKYFDFKILVSGAYGAGIALFNGGKILKILYRKENFMPDLVSTTGLFASSLFMPSYYNNIVSKSYITTIIARGLYEEYQNIIDYQKKEEFYKNSFLEQVSPHHKYSRHRHKIKIQENKVNNQAKKSYLTEDLFYIIIKSSTPILIANTGSYIVDMSLKTLIGNSVLEQTIIGYSVFIASLDYSIIYKSPILTLSASLLPIISLKEDHYIKLKDSYKLTVLLKNIYFISKSAKEIYKHIDLTNQKEEIFSLKDFNSFGVSKTNSEEIGNMITCFSNIVMEYKFSWLLVEYSSKAVREEVLFFKGGELITKSLVSFATATLFSIESDNILSNIISTQKYIDSNIISVNYGLISKIELVQEYLDFNMARSVISFFSIVLFDGAILLASSKLAPVDYYNQIKTIYKSVAMIKAGYTLYDIFQEVPNFNATLVKDGNQKTQIFPSEAILDKSSEIFSSSVDLITKLGLAGLIAADEV